MAGAQDSLNLRWQFSQESSIESTSHLQNVIFSHDGMEATTEFDPYFFLALPKNPIDAKQYHYLSVELYSSEAANNLAVYYKSPNGNWGLGSTPFPVQKGWHQYVMDMEKQARWAKSTDAAASPVWGGTEKLINKLRLDPGDEKGREIKVREVILSTKPIVIPPTTSWQWKTADDLLGWTPDNFSTAEVKEDVLQGQTKYDSHLLSSILNIDAESWPMLEFRLKSSVGGNGQIFFRHDGESMSGARQINFSITGDNQFHIYQVNLAANAQWKGNIAQIRFDPLDPANAQLQLEYLRFLPKNIGGIIHNGGFELTDTKTALPQDWTFENLTPKIVNGVNSSQAMQLTTGAKVGVMQSAQFEFADTGQYQLSLDYRSESPAKTLAGKILYFDIFHHPLTPQTLSFPVSPNTHVESTFQVSPLAAYGQVEFEVPPLSRITLDNITLNRTRAQIPAWQERWSASWIMAADAATQPDASRYYRQDFPISDTSKVTAAKVQLTGDDNARLFINGHELTTGANWNNWRLVDTYDIRPYLQNGKNVIGIVSQNQSSAEGVIAVLNVIFSDSEYSVETDKDWKTFVGKADMGWAKSTFDAGSWKPAIEIGAPPVAPWGELPYNYLGRRTPIQTQHFSAPQQAELGQKVDVQFDFVPQENPFHGTALKLQLVPLDAADMSVFNFPPIALNDANWKKGAPVQLRESVQLPRYFPAGEYNLKASFAFATISGKAEQRISLKSPPALPSPVTKVVYLPGHVPAFDINGKILPVMHTMTNDSAVPAMQKAIVENSRDNNVNLIWLNIREFDWNPDGKSTFQKMDEAVNAVLEANPHAYIVLNVNIDPSRNLGMRKWFDLHPDQLIRKEDGTTALSGYRGVPNRGEKYASFASKIWIDDATQSWRELIRHVRSGPYADRVIGYVPIAGISAEWFYYGSQGQDFVDYSKPFTEAFANWAKAQYHGDLALLNKTWNTHYASFDAIQLPSKEQRMAADHGAFLDPAKSGEVIDLREFFTQVISGDILDFCHVVKEETNNTAICGTYYGYVMYIGRAYFGVHSGHFALDKVLASPDIDFLMTPSRYQDRGLGGSSGFMTAVDSFKLHGKLYIDQADIRTLHATDPIGKVDTLTDSVSVLEREFANTIINGVAPQWYDFGNGWITGDARLMQAVGKMWQIAKTLQQTPRETIDAPNSIAVITDEKSILYTKVDSMIQDAANNQEIDQLNRTGAAWDNYLLNDLPKLGKYHYFIFLNCFNLSDAQRKYIDDNLKKDGNVLVWINSPGIIDDSKSTFAQATYDPNRVSEVTGFQLKQIPDGPLVNQMLADDNPLQHDILKGTVFGSSRLSGIRFVPQDGVALGQFPDDNLTSLAIKKFPNWTSIYSSAPTLPAALLRNIAKMANVPVINNRAGDVTYVSKNLFAVHSLGGGERVFTVGANYKTAKEVFSDQTYKVQNGQFTVMVPSGGTMLFLLEN